METDQPNPSAIESGADEKTPGAGEIVIGLIGPLGADLSRITELLQAEFRLFDYQVPPPIHLASFLSSLTGWREIDFNANDLKQEDIRIKALQQAGDQLCQLLERADAMALLGVREVFRLRGKLTGDPDPVVPSPRTIYIIRSIKRAEEVRFLRKLYGPFCLFLAAYSPRESRVKQLATKIAHSHNSMDDQAFRSKAEDLINRDESEGDDYGQSVQEAFPLADAFVNADEAATLPKQVARFVRIVFGDPTESPTKDEFGMFLAQAAALRSADLSRQVGAVITTEDADVISVGTNEVPKPGGGLYWIEDDGDDRDCKRGKDESLEMKQATAKELFSLLDRKGKLSTTASEAGVDKLIKELWPYIKDTRLGGIGEFSRTVHAEMAAIIDAAKRGVSVKGGTLYVTTFPCHNCTRHIIAAGIGRVVYIQPYPKSLAEFLHRKAIVVDSPKPVEGQVNYQPFVGISPNRYGNLFEYRKDERKHRIRPFNKEEALPRYLESWHSPVYGPVEKHWISLFEKKLAKAGLRFSS